MQTSESETVYRRLQRHLDRMPVAFPATPSGVELRILQRLFTPEEAEIALELSAIPEPPATIQRRFGSRMTLEKLRGELEQMAAKGSILAFPVAGEMRYGKNARAASISTRHSARPSTPARPRNSALCP